MHTIRIAFRNLNRQKKRSFLLGGAIAFGLLIVTLVNGAAGGFQRNIADNFSHLFGGQVFIQGLERTASGKRVSVIHDDAAVLASIQGAGGPGGKAHKEHRLPGNPHAQRQESCPAGRRPGAGRETRW